MVGNVFCASLLLKQGGVVGLAALWGQELGAAVSHNGRFEAFCRWNKLESLFYWDNDMCVASSEC